MVIKTYTLANSTGEAILYFYNYSTLTKYEIYQGNTLIRTANNATALSSTDRTFLTGNSVPSSWMTSPYINLSGTLEITAQSAKGPGKISWTHNPSNGREYTIKATKSSTARQFRFAFKYPINVAAIECDIPDDPPDDGGPTDPPPPPPNYDGFMKLTPAIASVHIVYEESNDSGGPIA